MPRLFMLLALAFPGTAGALDIEGEVPMEEYLELLKEVSPAARDGVEVYRQAVLAKCGRPVTVLDLRRAVAEGDGDPILMSMIRAVQQRDRGALRDLSLNVPCSR